MKNLIVLSLLFPLTIPAFTQKTIFFTGTTNAKEDTSIHICELNEATGEMQILDKFPGAKGPGYLCISENGKFLYATSGESFSGEKNQHSIITIRISRNPWKLERINQSSSYGIHPCHISLTPGSKMLLTANYSSGSVSAYPLEKGIPGKVFSKYQHSGSGPVTDRQEGPHAHYISASPDSKFIYSADLGIDKIMIYKNIHEQKIETNPEPSFLQLSPGSGPRHMAFHPKDQRVFILTELSNEIISCLYNPENGSLKIMDIQSTLEDDFSDYTKAAAIRIHPKAEYVYCSNRGENSIAVFRYTEQGLLEKIQSYKGETANVRDFNITPSGKYLIAGNQDKDEVFLLEINEDGTLSSTGNKLKISRPTCIEFYPGKD